MRELNTSELRVKRMAYNAVPNYKCEEVYFPLVCTYQLILNLYLWRDGEVGGRRRGRGRGRWRGEGQGEADIFGAFQKF